MNDPEPLNADQRHYLLYQADDGTRISLVVPWGFGTGLIPPPDVIFTGDDGTRRFFYQGSEIV